MMTGVEETLSSNSDSKEKSTQTSLPPLENHSNIDSDQKSFDLTRIYLRPLELSDLEDAMVWVSDEKVTKFLSWEPKDMEGTIKYIVDTNSSLWSQAICLEDSAIGCVSIFSLSGNDKSRAKSAEIGYVLGSKYWGKGIATQVVKIVANTIFSELPQLERLEALVDEENIGSQRVLEKAGFYREGILRKYLFIKGRSRDVVMFSLLSTDDPSTPPIHQGKKQRCETDSRA